MPPLTQQQLDSYDRDGFLLLKGLFTHAEADAVVTHMMDLAHGKKTLAGFKAPDTTTPHWGRTMNQHFYDPVAMNLLLHPKLREPLEGINGGPVDAVQTMYFWQGSTQRRHQDQYYLPACFSAWCAFCDVSPDNGTLFVQPGSHKRKLFLRDELPKKPDGSPGEMFHEHYNDFVDEIFKANALPEVPVLASKGDVLLFHGKLIHRGGPIGVPGSFRHVMANHYIPYNFQGWPYGDWPRYSYTGEKRLTDPATKVTRVV
jgi:hypothetical protein